MRSVTALLLVAVVGAFVVSTASATTKEGLEFLAKYEEQEDAHVTASGLRYKILKESGSDVSPTRSDRVKVHYRGTLIDGTEFDSSYKRGSPATFGVTQVIKGWTEALQAMHVGDKWEVAIPSELGYGEMQRGRFITPGAVLLFEMELLEIV